MSRFGQIINNLEEAIIALLLASMTILVFVEVVLRFGFGIGFMWGEEVTLHLSAWMVQSLPAWLTRGSS